ncbi:MAG: GxxExxY protein [Syntrophaceae bacterium]|nr:GxxExxY protein [Syntrophaceae bacterium]
MTTNSTNIIYRDLSYPIMAAVFEVHKVLGPGFLESIYEKALIKELEGRGIKVETQKVIDLMYKDRKIGIHRLDLVVDSKVVIELKTVERFSVHHKAQLTSYLKASGYKLGVLVNFSKSKVEYQRVLIR